MKCRHDQLPQQLNKGLAAIYLLHGDNPLLIQECSDMIRQAARRNGYEERQRFQVETGFDWQSFLQSTQNLSLFCSKQLIELHLPSGKPGDKGSKAFKTYTEQLPPDTILMVVCNKLESASLRANWFKMLDSQGLNVHVWPIDREQLPVWIKKRLAQFKLQASDEALNVLADQTEGNLLATAQTIEKLALMHDANTTPHVSLDEVLAASQDSAHFDVFQLVDTCLSGQAKKAIHILRHLRAEGIEPTIIVWALARECRSISTMANGLRQQGITELFRQYRVWEKRKPIISHALKRHPESQWQHFLVALQSIDQMIKGFHVGDPWRSLESQCLAIAGYALNTACITS